MTFFEVILLSIALSMDACAVAMTNGMVYNNVKKCHMAAMPIIFGLFQGAMPLLGYYTGTLFHGILEKYSGFVILAILGSIGIKMIFDGFSHKNDEKLYKPCLTFIVLMMQAVATSIDAFAVGIAFTAMNVPILPVVLVITVVTALLVTIAIFLGKLTGGFFGSKAGILGGIILIIIGIKAVM
ncbi:MAG: manganese efflux pump [Eubacteriales bacterium]|nr:manganese efflux pump [Eubacteriales bacterium]MDD4390007.1 manganese efflux pump [Eubacteriales bacterium]